MVKLRLRSPPSGTATSLTRMPFFVMFLLVLYPLNNEILLFSDPAHIGLVDTREFRTTTALEHHRKNIQLGLRIGQAALVEFALHGSHMKAVWILMSNKLSSTTGGSDPMTRNPFWKFVVPTISYFAWLPEGLANTFCAEALATSKYGRYADPACCYHNLEEIEGPKNTKRGFGVPAELHGLTPLGDTRNSQELSVFCQMPRERLRVSCGLVQEDGAVSHHPDSRGQLVRASQRLLRFLLVGPDAQHDFMHAETLLHVFRFSPSG